MKGRGQLVPEVFAPHDLAPMENAVHHLGLVDDFGEPLSYGPVKLVGSGFQVGGVRDFVFAGFPEPPPGQVVHNSREAPSLPH